jgi:hypothetical protein
MNRMVRRSRCLGWPVDCPATAAVNDVANPSAGKNLFESDRWPTRTRGEQMILFVILQKPISYADLAGLAVTQKWRKPLF